MYICALAGDSGFPGSVQTELRRTLIDLIENHEVDLFYMIFGGKFNLMAAEELKKIIKDYPDVYFEVFLCNVPYREYNRMVNVFYNITVVDGEDGETREHALNVLKESIIDVSEYVITYVKNVKGDAVTYKNIALEKGKKIIELNKQQNRLS